MKIVIAPDSFKGSLSSVQAASLIAEGVYKVFPHAQIVQIPVADGGEGTLRSLTAYCEDSAQGLAGGREHLEQPLPAKESRPKKPFESDLSDSAAGGPLQFVVAPKTNAGLTMHQMPESGNSSSDGGSVSIRPPADPPTSLPRPTPQHSDGQLPHNEPPYNPQAAGCDPTPNPADLPSTPNPDHIAMPNPDRGSTPNPDCGSISNPQLGLINGPLHRSTSNPDHCQASDPNCAPTPNPHSKNIQVLASDPLGRPLKASFGAINGKAIVEMASASGLCLLTPNERNALITDSYGTGQILMSAIKAGYKEIILGIGGSAVNDGGSGIARALGYQFLDADGRHLSPGGAALKELASIDDSLVPSQVKDTRILVACDVDNCLLGENGASAVYGPQKGAGPNDVKQLDEALTHFANVVEEWKGSALRNIPGAGAAGGAGFGLMAFCNAHLQSGIDTVLDAVGFSEKIKDADLVITGEGSVDGQSVRGKVPVGVARRAKAAGVPVLVVAGNLGKGAESVYSYGVYALMSTTDRIMSEQNAIARSAECLENAAERACRLIIIGMNMGRTKKSI